ncbi:GDSL-type esterase/lipase family protein [Agromyces soli]|uniref:D-inositol 3-phosphate glycosyltransferase n=1 Tax=Agromyces soli TaxID=659012 RepID=A0ABY4AUG9_9MICO|nr:glycosyltransferase [Agromyces soli]UOE25816.1 glycosyltransferase [Agromyces soli]
MKVAILAESFLPHMNGVTHSLLQVLGHLERAGHEALVIAPRAGRVDEAALRGARLVQLPSTPLPRYPQVRIAVPGLRRLTAALAEFSPDVVHLASPFVLGWQGVRAAEAIGAPSVAVYQTDVPAYAARYGVPAAAPALERHVARLHGRATLTLAPSSSALERLDALGVSGSRLWRRGVDLERFRPGRRDEAWRRRIAPGGEVVVGYVGRLAPEKQVEDLLALRGVPGIQLVVVGDGPSRDELEALLPDAVFTGFLGGEELATTLASFDVFVHPGESETFCQTVQEAHASGVPVVATGAGGPLDLVRQSVDGWLYRPGDLDEFAARVADLAGDAAKRRAFGRAARRGVVGRGWDVLCEELLAHYRDARARAAGLASAAPGQVAPAPPAPHPASVPGPAEPGRTRAAEAPLRFVAVGDSLTEGLCDDSRTAPGEYRGWADRLAMLLAMSRPGPGVEYANLAVRSRRIRDVVDEQLPAALALGAELVGIFVGGNDLVQRGADPVALADQLGAGLRAAAAAGCRVLVVTPFLPERWEVRGLRARFARFDARLRALAAEHGAVLVDVEHAAELRARSSWAADRVHLNPAGHRTLAYAAARALGIPDAAVLADLELALHDGAHRTRVSGPAWMAVHVLPWVVRRLRGRTAGEGRSPKRPELALLRIPAPTGAALLESKRLPEWSPHRSSASQRAANRN